MEVNGNDWFLKLCDCKDFGLDIEWNCIFYYVILIFI